jgi:hypothetical protein
MTVRTKSAFQMNSATAAGAMEIPVKEQVPVKPLSGIDQ